MAAYEKEKREKEDERTVSLFSTSIAKFVDT
jgi:hypothetical protein